MWFIRSMYCFTPGCFSRDEHRAGPLTSSVVSRSSNAQRLKKSLQCYLAGASIFMPLLQDVALGLSKKGAEQWPSAAK